MGECLFMRRGTIRTAPFVPKPTFANNTWAEIVRACHTNRVPDSWAVGNQKTMTIGGVNYTIDIIGKNHDDYADGSGKAPLTFQLHDCYNKDGVNGSSTNVGGWTYSGMRATKLPAIMALMPGEVQAGIRRVNKQTSEGSQRSTIVTTADKLFLLSEVEVRGVIPFSFSGEGSRYDYYSNGNSSVKYFSGALTGWWTRSPRNLYTTQFCIVSTSDNSSDVAVAAATSGVAPAFCF